MINSNVKRVAPAVQLNEHSLDISDDVLRRRFNAETVRPGTPTKKNRPKGHKFYQQKLTTLRPIYNAANAIICFVLVAVITIPIGIIFIIEANSIIEITIPYTHCLSDTTMGLKDDGSPMTMECAEWLIATPVAQSPTTNAECKCVIPVTINESLKNDVIFYYGLDNFYQNHRRYHSSRNDDQLLGDLSNVQGCKPFQATEDGTVILPCGAIANSMFNDTFSLKYKLPNQNSIPVDEIVPMTYKGILSKSYIESKFRNPSDKNLTRAFAGYAKPPAWSKRLEMLDKANPANNGLQNTDFMVWMAAAALPSFRKPWRMLDRNASDNFKDGLPAGNYTLHVTYNYPVLQFDGGKRFIITSKSWLGSKNYFTGVAFCSVGLICLINGVVFCIIQFKFGHPS